MSEWSIDMAAMIRVWYDEEGDYLEFTFADAPGYFQEIADDIYERVDQDGNLLGYAFFNAKLRAEGTALAMFDFADYLPNLLDYEDRLSRGEIVC